MELGLSPFAHVLVCICESLREWSEELGRLDAVAGDGDLGMTVIAATNAVVDIARSTPDGSPAELLKASGTAVTRKAASTSGTLIGLGLKKAAESLERGPTDAVEQLARAVRAATEEIRVRGRADLGDKTMLDVLIPVSECLEESSTSNDDLADALRKAADAASRSALETASLIPRVGRARWMADNSVGSVDAGCQLLSAIFKEAVKCVSSRAEDI